MGKEKVTVNVTEIERHQLSNKLGDTHLNILPTRKLLIVLGTLSLACMLSFADQTGVTVGLSVIGEELNSETTINWAGTSSLLANCVCQILFGRLSDIFGRKSVMLTCLGILAVADLCCGFAQTGVQFFIFRAFAGVGNGAVSSLCMVILSDIVTLEQRGKYQGILGSSVGIGNSIGPFLMGAFIKHTSWRDFYYLISPLMVIIMVIVYFLIDGKSKDLDKVLSNKDKFKKIDYLGILTSTISLILLLIPISGGGSTYAWNSPLVISMLIIGGVFFVVFLLIEWKIPKLPMIPLHLFKSPSLCLLLTSNFFFGMVYYSFLYFLPYHFTLVKQKDIIHTSLFLLPLVLTQALGSIISGQLVTKTGHYIFVVIAGYSLWLISNCLLLLWNKNLNDGINVLVLLIMGLGVGFTFQPTMVACQAQSRKCDRAVVISTRNVLRSFGGAVGVAVGSTIVSNSLLNEINTKKAQSIVPHDYLNNMKTHIYSIIDTNSLNNEQFNAVVDMYDKSLRNYFYLLIPLIGICLLSSFFIKDRGLRCIDEIDNHDTESSFPSSRNSTFGSSSSNNSVRN